MMKWRLVHLFLALAVVTGCTSQPGAITSSEEATVKGQVTIQGKKVTAGTIVFKAEGHEPVEATVQKDGTFTLTSWAGTNMVTVQGKELEQAVANMPPQQPTDLMPGENTVDLIY
jgi:hypothetical protein